MHARVATFEGDPATIDAGIDRIRSDVEAGAPPGLENIKGVMVLVDRKSGKSMGITLFDSEADMQKGDEVLNNMSGGPGQRAGVEFYEVAVQRML